MKHEAILRKQARKERDAQRGRLGPGRADALVRQLAAAIQLAFEAGATATLFGLEGPLRHAIRSDLCLQGWSWTEADSMARDMLEQAFRAARASRPAWNEGQKEWTLDGGTLIGHTRCIRCCKPLPEGHFKYCSHLCTSAHHNAIARIKNANEDQAVKLAIRSI